MPSAQIKDPTVAARLFSASLGSRFQGGLLVMIVGKTMQLIFSAAVRGEQSPSRILHWTAMKAAMEREGGAL